MKTPDAELEQALDRMIDHARALDADELPFDFGGHEQAEIDAHSATLDRPIPPEVAALYRRVQGQEHSMRYVWLVPLNETYWLDSDETMGLSWLEEEYPNWHAASYFVFGHGGFGDRLVYCPNPPGRSAGSIIMVDHEGAGPDGRDDQPCTIVFYGDSLAQWIEQWVRHDFVEYNYLLGEIDDALSPDQAEAFRNEHERLNPGVLGSNGAQ